MSPFLFKEMEEDARRREEARRHARDSSPPPEASGWQLRVVGNLELEEGWNEPIPPKRDWVVHHYYEGRRSLCGDYSYQTAWPPKPHFQVESPLSPSYRMVSKDWLCKCCLAHRMGRILPPLYGGQTRVITISSYEPYQIYIGAANTRLKLPASVWANPDRDARKRPLKEARASYRIFVLTNDALLSSLPELRGKTLACGCTVHGDGTFCHGDVLVELADVADRTASGSHLRSRSG